MADASGGGAPYYRAIADEAELFARAQKERLPLLLKGPTGSGKSRFVEAMAHGLGRTLVTVACNDETTAGDLLGRYLVRGGDTVWQDGPATRAVRIGAVLYLDEIAEAREDVLVVLHALADHRRTLYLDRRDETLVAPPEFQLVASFNPGYRHGARELKPSTRQRFVTIAFAYPEEKIEIEIVRTETGVEAAIAKRLVGYARKVRSLDELGLAETVSTRLLVAAGRLIRGGVAPRRAARVAIVEVLTDDAGSIEALQDLANLHF